MSRFTKLSVWLVCCCAAVSVSATLQIQDITVPSVVMSGSNVVLRCLYSNVSPSTSASLYSLKWYKGNHEFYRHLPSMDDSPTKVFPWSDFNIEKDTQEPGKVILREVNLDADGTYKCEVSQEGDFHTDSMEANLTVIHVEDEELTLSQVPPRREARPGDRIRWICTFGPSRPRGYISWFVNGEPATMVTQRLSASAPKGNHVADSWEHVEGKQLEWTESTLELSLTERHFKNRDMRVSCIVQIAGTNYKRKTEAHLYLQQPIAANNNSPVVGSSRGSQAPAMAKIGSRANRVDGGNWYSLVSALLLSLQSIRLGNTLPR